MPRGWRLVARRAWPAAGGTAAAVAGVALVAALGVGAPAVRQGPAGQPGPARLAAGVWQVVPTVSPQAAAKTQSALFGASLTSASDGWAVGNLVTTVPNPQGGPRLVVSRALAERWNGTRWQQVAMAQPATQHALLQGVLTWARARPGLGLPGTCLGPAHDLAAGRAPGRRRWRIVSTPGSSAKRSPGWRNGLDAVWVAG